MKLKDFLKQFDGLDPEIEVYKGKVFGGGPLITKDFSKSFGVVVYQVNEKTDEEKIIGILL